MPRLPHWLLGTAFILLLLARSHAQAETSAAKASAKVILEKGWQPTAQARSLADQEFAAAQDHAPTDPFLLGAYWMALANQSRYDDALVPLDSFLKQYPQYVPALHAKAWIHTVLKQYPQAMDAATTLTLAIVQKPAPVGTPARAEQDEALEFVGRLAAYLEKPLETVVDQGRRAKFEATLLAAFDPAGKAHFEQGKQAVFAKFEQLRGNAAVVNQKAQEAAEENKEKKIAELDKEKEKLAEEAKKVAEREKETADRLKLTLDTLHRQLNAAGSRIAQLQDKVTGLNNQVNLEQRNIDRIKQRQAQANDKQLQKQLGLDLVRAQNNILGFQRQMEALNGQIGETKANYNNLQQQINGLQVGGNALGQQFDNQRAELERKGQKTEGRQRREQNKATAAKSGSLDARLRSLSTYATLPLDELRTTLLDKLQQ